MFHLHGNTFQKINHIQRYEPSESTFVFVVVVILKAYIDCLTSSQNLNRVYAMFGGDEVYCGMMWKQWIPIKQYQRDWEFRFLYFLK